MPQQGQGGASLGLGLRPLTPAIARQVGVDPSARGLVIVGVDPSSDAAQIGLRQGDLVLSVNREAVTSPEQVEAAVQQAQRAGRRSVALLIQRGRSPARYVSVPFRQ